MAADAVALIDVDENLAADRLHVFVTVARLRRAVRATSAGPETVDLSKANEAEVTSSARDERQKQFLHGRHVLKAAENRRKFDRADPRHRFAAF